jgi:hypothetical protein
MRTIFTIGLLVLCLTLLGLSGCSTLQVWMGTRIRLEKTPVVAMKVYLPKGSVMYPGEESPLVVTVTGSDGKTIQTEGAGKGKVMWQDLRITSEIVSVNGDGIVSMPSDPRLSDGKLAHLTVTAPSHPGIRAELEVKIRYDHSFTVDCSGRPGMDGMNGTDGSDGFSGSSSSTDIDNPSPGGDGSNGGNGGDGYDGSRGHDAQPVQVWVTLRPGDFPLLQSVVYSGDKARYFLIDALRGGLTVTANGGAGGAGGKGGRGGRGGRGGNGWPSGMSGMDGMSGLDGWAGAPGKGGAITLEILDPRARPYLSQIKLSSRDGDGRPGPQPILVEQPIPPIW